MNAHTPHLSVPSTKDRHLVPIDVGFGAIGHATPAYGRTPAGAFPRARLRPAGKSQVVPENNSYWMVIPLDRPCPLPPISNTDFSWCTLMVFTNHDATTPHHNLTPSWIPYFLTPSRWVAASRNSKSFKPHSGKTGTGLHSFACNNTQIHTDEMRGRIKLYSIAHFGLFDPGHPEVRLTKLWNC
jgi:hypothetical protein